jgi:hypothetical protein
MTFLGVFFIVMQTGEISAIITKSALWAYRFREHWIKFRTAVKAIQTQSE